MYHHGLALDFPTLSLVLLLFDDVLVGSSFVIFTAGPHYFWIVEVVAVYFHGVVRGNVRFPWRRTSSPPSEEVTTECGSSLGGDHFRSYFDIRQKWPMEVPSGDLGIGERVPLGRGGDDVKKDGALEGEVVRVLVWRHVNGQPMSNSRTAVMADNYYFCRGGGERDD